MNNAEFYKALEDAGHLLRRDEVGEVDFFVLDSGYHNGPGCELCHECGASTAKTQFSLAALEQLILLAFAKICRR